LDVDLTRFDVLHPRFEADHRLLVLELDHGKANEMGTAQLDAFAALCDLVENDASIACVCTTSRRTSKSGKPIFISGADVTERVGWDDDRIRAHVVRQRGLLRRIRHLPVFHVVLTHGVTFGWGVEYVLTGDYALATPQATFALPETGLGILPGARGTAELADAVGPTHALRLGCTGETLAAAEALRIGLVAELVDDVEHGLARARELAALLARRSPTAVAAFKAALLAGRGCSEDERLELERRAYEHVVASGDAAIGRAAFAEVRAGTIPAWPPRRPWRPV
jgi:enoyl-CoA hydratase/carnithine racemase